MTDGKTTFETMREKQPCEPNKLKQHFYRHNFNICSDVVDSIELKDAPSFIRQLQDVNNTELPYCQNSDCQINGKPQILKICTFYFC